MCSTDPDEDWVHVPYGQRSLGGYWRNVMQRGSIGWKVERWTANTLRRMRKRSTCCGHPGEPGC